MEAVLDAARDARLGDQLVDAARPVGVHPSPRADHFLGHRIEPITRDAADQPPPARDARLRTRDPEAHAEPPIPALRARTVSARGRVPPGRRHFSGRALRRSARAPWAPTSRPP
ncbi:MAG: hypothetical protein ACKOHI_08290, partial [Phycisphaerales bacterium]